MPAFTPIVCVGMVGKPVSTASDEVPAENVSNVHCKRERERGEVNERRTCTHGS